MGPGTYLEIDGRPAVRFERTYPHPIDRVWSAISEPDELRHWFPSAVEIDGRAGGAVEFSGDPNLVDSRGTVLVYEPPRRLAFTWGRDELHFELEPDGDGCRLTLTNVLDQRNAAARNASGWSVCLGVLDRHLAGVTVGGPHAPDAQVPPHELYEDYVAAGLPSGAPIPGRDDT